MQRLALSCCAWLALVGAAAAADWPQWQGPNRDNKSGDTGLLKEWPKSGPRKLWMINTADLGYSAPAVVGDKLYCQGATADDGEFAFCIDVLTHKEVWKTKIANKFFENNWGGGPRGTPCVDGDKVYIIGPMSDVACLNAADGKLVWQKNMVKDFGGKLMSGWGFSESPLVDGNKLICTPGGKAGTIAALDKATGKLLWQSDSVAEDAAYSSAVIGTVGTTRMYIQQTGKGVIGVSAETGKLLWRQDGDAYKVAVIPTPIFHEGLVYCTSDYGAGCMLVKLEAEGTDKIKATKLYANKTMQNHHGGIVLLDGHIFGCTGNSNSRGSWICQELLTGKSVWNEEKGQESGSLAFADGQLYTFGQKKGEVVRVEASTKGWKETGRFALPELTKLRKPQGAIWTHPVIANGRLYLRDQELLYCYDLRESKSAE